MRRNQFQNLIDSLLDMAYQLNKIRDVEIKEVFPLMGTLGDTDSNFHHSPWDFQNRTMFYSEIPDGIAALDVIRKMSAILSKSLTLVSDLYPTKIKSGDIYVDFETTFDRIREVISRGLDDLDKIAQMIEGSLSSRPTEIISLPALRNLREKITVMGYKFVESDFKEIPPEMIGRYPRIINKRYMRRVQSEVSPLVKQFSKDDEIDTSLDVNFYGGWNNGRV